jgi:hypothetical protein
MNINLIFKIAFNTNQTKDKIIIFILIHILFNSFSHYFIRYLLETYSLINWFGFRFDFLINKTIKTLNILLIIIF